MWWGFMFCQVITNTLFLQAMKNFILFKWSNVRAIPNNSAFSKKFNKDVELSLNIVDDRVYEFFFPSGNEI